MDREADETDTRTADEGRGPLDQRIGPYRLLRELGHGGMGVVYLAARADEQYQRRVAIKVIKAGQDRDEVVARFRRERQILASLDHPHIARFFDGGTTDDGRPYFVMEYVEGQPIDAYCDRNGLSTAERLKLVRAVCSALEYAHRNLIVHRDVKPGNILVTTEGVAKLLDFGIAKLVNPGLLGDGGTATGLAFTPEYASPEQARGEPVTTVSDVYAVGVVMYRLLTGGSPYRTQTGGPLEVLRSVVDEEPEKPSTAGPERLRRHLRGDLDTIVMTALRKEPSRRYPSVEALSEDIRRHLEGIPIKARKATVSYRARKFVQRHQVSAPAVALGVVLILGFSAHAVLQSRRLARERDRATAESARAAQERDKAARVSSFLVNLFKVSDPGEARGNTVTAREILDQGSERIREELKDEPEVRATLLDTMGSVYESLGLYTKSEGLFRDSLAARGPVHDEVELARTKHNLGRLLGRKGDYAASEAAFRDALDLRRRLLGPEHPDTVASMNGLANVAYERGDYAQAEPLYRETLALRRKLRGPEHPEVANSMNGLANTLMERGAYAEADALYREKLALERKLYGGDHPRIAITLGNLAEMRRKNGDHAAAEPLYREALALRRRLLGDAHPDVVISLGDLGGELAERGELAAGEAMLRDALGRWQRLTPEDNAETAAMMGALAAALTRKGQLVEAEALARRCLEIRRLLLSPGSPRISDALTDLGTLLVLKGDARAAEPLLREALDDRRRVLPPEHPDTAATESALGACLSARGQFPEAEALLVRSYGVLRTARPEQDRLVRTARARVAMLYDAWGKPDRAREYAPIALASR